MLTRRLLALTAMLALVAACACAFRGWSLWRMQREATRVAARLSPLPASDPPDQTQSQPVTSVPPAAPAVAAAQRHLEVAWEDGNGRPFRSRITLDAVDRARVETTSHGSPMVAYSGSAQRRGDGSLHIDATDAAVSGPAAAEWIADSFVIRADGSVSVQDGKNEPCDGYLAQDDQPQTP